MKQNTTFTIVIFLLYSLSEASFCQTAFNGMTIDTVQNHYFLWFHGHWNQQKKNTFNIIPPNGIGSGGTATVSSSGNVNIQTSGMDDWDTFVDNGINDLDKWDKDLKSPAHDYREWSHHLNIVLLPEINRMKKELNDFKVTKEDKKVDIEKEHLQQLAQGLQNGCTSFKPRYEEIMNYCKAHSHDKDSDLKVPPPPEIDFTCSECDTNIQNTNQKIIDDYLKKFPEPEGGMIRDLLPKLRDMALLGVNGSYTLGSHSGIEDIVINDFYKKNGVCSYLHKDEMWNAVIFLANHVLRRAQKLVDDYHKDIKTQPVVTKTYLSVLRQNILLGNGKDNLENGRYFQKILRMVYDEYYYYKDRLFKDHDWSQLSNFHLLFEFIRTYQMLGGGQLDNWTNLVSLLNNFQLSIEMDIKAGGNGRYIIAHLKGKTKIAPEFNPDSNKCYTWVACKDQTDQYGAPIKEDAGKIHCDLLNTEIVAPGPHPVYIGTHNYYTQLKLLKMDFCHPGQDTILFTQFNADPVTSGLWKYPYGPNHANNIWELDTYFKSNNKTIELAKSGALEQQAQVTAQTDREMIAKLQAMKSKFKSGNFSMSDVHKIQEMVNQSQSSANNKNLSPAFYIDFPLDIHNNTTTIFHQRFDSKQVSPVTAPAVIYGYMTIDITYTGK